MKYNYIFFSDHGGCIPRGKGYLYESGLKVPLIVYFPPKWQHLAKQASGKEYSLVNFTDLGPTVLSLAGVKPPKQMQGKALYGKFDKQRKRQMQFALAANQLHHFMPVRAVTDGRFKYIRSYIPYRQFALRNYYQWGMPSNKAWDKLVLEGHNTNPNWKLTFEAHPAEMLFDLEKIRMNCTTYPVLPNMQKSCPKCAKHYLTIFVSPVIWGSSFPLHAPVIFFTTKCARRNIL